MSKKLLSFLLAGALALSAAACGQGAASAPQQPSAPQSAASAAGPSSAEAKEVDWPTDTVKIYVAEMCIRDRPTAVTWPPAMCWSAGTSASLFSAGRSRRTA